MRMHTRIATLTLTLAAAITPTGCGKGDDPKPTTPTKPAATAPEPAKPAEPHHHDAPHGGALVKLGGDHIEFKLDPEAGKLSAWVLDGEAAKPVRIADPSIKVMARLVDKDGADVGKSAIDLNLAPVASDLTGESVGDSSLFEATSDELRGAVGFEGYIDAVTIRGTRHSGVSFAYPKGNEP